MRVTSVYLYSALIEEPISFSLQGADPNAQYMVRSIVGIDAEEIIPKFYGSSIDGQTKYFDFSMKPRDIVLRVVLNPRGKLDETYSDIRDRLYRAISANRTGQVKLHFNSGATTVSGIFGAITKFESAYFNKLPEVQITIRCPDPMFKGLAPVIMTPPQLTSSKTVLVPDSMSTAPHGFKMHLKCNTAGLSNFIIRDQQANNQWEFNVVSPLDTYNVGDDLYISSENSNKYVYTVRGGTTYQAADRVYPNSMWPILFPGQNSFYFLSLGPGSGWDWVDIQFYPNYWGI